MTPMDNQRAQGNLLNWRLRLCKSSRWREGVESFWVSMEGPSQPLDEEKNCGEGHVLLYFLTYVCVFFPFAVWNLSSCIHELVGANFPSSPSHLPSPCVHDCVYECRWVWLCLSFGAWELGKGKEVSTYMSFPPAWCDEHREPTLSSGLYPACRQVYGSWFLREQVSREVTPPRRQLERSKGDKVFQKLGERTQERWVGEEMEVLALDHYTSVPKSFNEGNGRM